MAYTVKKKITQKISNFPAAPNSATDTPAVFSSKADAFVGHQAATYVTEVNTWKDQANALATEMGQIKDQVNTITSSIPTGTINDGIVSTTSVHSSKKMQDDMAHFAGAYVPKSGGNFDSLTVGGKHVVTTGTSGEFIKSAGGTMTGELSFKGNSIAKGMYLYKNDSDTVYTIKFGMSGTGGATIYNKATGSEISLPASGDVSLNAKDHNVVSKSKLVAKSNIQLDYSSTGWAEIIGKKSGAGVWKVGNEAPNGTSLLLKSYSSSVVLKAGDAKGIVVESENTGWNEIVGKSGGISKWKIGLFSKGGKDAMVKSYEGNVSLLASKGKVTANGKTVVTGELHGSTLNLTI